MPDRAFKILHVDDNEANRYAVSRTLTKAGFIVSEAATGQQATAQINSDLDLIILDIRLPDITGFELCRRIKADEKTSHIPVLHLSASANTSEDKARGLDGGADAYLVRPVDPLVLVATVKVLLRNREMEEALRRSEERFRLIANTIPQLAWMAEPNGEVYWYNDRFLEYTGMTFEQLKGLGWKAAHDPNELPRVLKRFEYSLLTGEPWEDTFPIRSKSGEFRWHLSRALPQRDDAGKIIMWFGTNTDVTDQREHEGQLRDSKREAESARAVAEQANRLKDDFLATLSHELRTPLNAIVGWTEILRTGRLETGELEEGLEIIERNAKAQSQMIDDLLDVSRIISGKLRLDVQRIDLVSVVDQAMSTIGHSAAAKNVRLSMQICVDAASTFGDAARLQQVMWNLLSNAIKFTDGGGQIVVSLKRVDGLFEITVIDTGRGISPAFLPHVFERFRQADSSSRRSHGGLGLGLAIVRQLVEGHGGSVDAASQGEGKGACFSVRLPVYATRHDFPSEPLRLPSDRKATPLPALADLNGLKLLVVEDDPDSRQVVQRLLAGCGAEVVTAPSVARAMAEVDRSRFDIVVSDIGMPDQDGYDLIHQLRSIPTDRGGATPAIALTAFARSEDRTRIENAGYQAHIAKPADPALLTSTIANLAHRAPSNVSPSPAASAAALSSS